MPQKTAGAIRRRRLGLGLTLVDLAGRCASEGVPVHHSHLSKIERGMFSPRPHLRVTLARVLDLDPSVFDTGSAPKAVI